MGLWPTHRHENPVESARTINLAWTAKVVCTLDEVRPFLSLKDFRRSVIGATGGKARIAARALLAPPNRFVAN
jgi:2-C-methyl-D-erythritol 4-phosphate cytidylyltransferase